ncbi:trypsin-like peptidase domain-containing protein [Streptomyces albus]|uniref:S1C family serine protease n=1 Tax=Streptomyces albus TaxID=1888 RepID=UPI0033D88760
MSTENEGASVPPAAGSDPTPPAPAQAPSAGAPTSGEDGDFSLPSPDPSAASASATASDASAASEASAASSSPSASAGGNGTAARTPGAETAARRTPNSAGVQDAEARQGGTATDTLVQTSQEASVDPRSETGARTAERAAADEVRPAPADAPPSSVPSQPDTPPVPAVPPAAASPDLRKQEPTTAGPTGPGAPAGPAGPGAGGTGQPGGWGYGAGDGTPPPPPPYGGAPGGGVPPHDPWAMPPGPGAPEPGGRKRRNGLVAAVVVAALVVGGVGGGIGYWVADRSANGGSTTISSSGDPGKLNRSPKSVAGIAAKALPSVVTIRSSGGGEEGTGTGFVFDKEGHILTNNHVVANAAQGGKLTATFSDGKKYDAHVVGNAQGYDIAVLKLSGVGNRKLDPLPLADSNNVAVGDATIAIGAPFGLSGTVTTGIVSAKNRPVASSDGQGSRASYMNALQTDASINPGNSGGPLLNGQGAVIGVNSAIQSGGGGGGMDGGQSGSVGLGFAIPSNQADRVAKQLIRTGEPVYPVIGATVELGGEGRGATISRTGENGTDPVTPNGPADDAGLEPGDVITKLDNTVIDSGPTLIGTIWSHKPGEKVKLTFERDGKERTVEVTLGTRKGDD